MFFVVHALFLVGIVNGGVTSTTAYRSCTNISSSGRMVDCQFFTSVYYAGTTGSEADSFIVNLVGVETDPTREGNIAQCPTGKRCTETTATTFKIDEDSTSTSFAYELTPMPFKIPWSYFISNNLTVNAEQVAVPDCAVLLDQIFYSGVIEDDLPVGPAASYYPMVNDDIICQHASDYNTDPFLGTETPPLSTSLSDYGTGLGPSPAPLAQYCEKCVKTSRRQYNSATVPSHFTCYCYDTTAVPYVDMVLEAIDLQMNANVQDDGQCTIYQIGKAQASLFLDIEVSTSAASYNQTIAVSYDTVSEPAVSVDSEMNDVLFTQVTGTGGLPDVPNNVNSPEEGSLLVLCPRPDGTLADISLPQSCNGDNSERNLWFYIPLKYAGYYGTGRNQYGNSVEAIIRNSDPLASPLGSGVPSCLDPTYLYFIPGYGNNDGVYYDNVSSAGSTTCNINQIAANKEPIIDADQVCYKSVSLQTMYSTMVHSPEKEHWTLPGIKSQLYSYSIVNGALVQNGGPNSAPPPPTPYTLRFDVADTFMKYLPTSDATGFFASNASTCVYTTRTGTGGTMKTSFCSNGYLDGSDKPTIFNLTAECFGAVSISNSSLITQSTVPLARGDCAPLTYPLFVNTTSVDLNVTNSTFCTVSADTAVVPEIFIACIGFPLPPSRSDRTTYIILGSIAAVILVFVIGFLCYQRHLNNVRAKDAEMMKTPLDIKMDKLKQQ